MDWEMIILLMILWGYHNTLGVYLDEKIMMMGA